MADTTQTLESNTNEPVAFNERTRRVMELRRAIQNGSYRRSDVEIAQALVREWSLLSQISRDEPAPSVETSADRKAAAARFLVTGTAAVEAQGPVSAIA